MLKFYYYKMPIDKHDLKLVLLNGFIASIIAGLLGGVIDALLAKINFSLEIGMFIICFAVGFRMKRAYKNYHILYPTLTFIFMFLGLLLDGYIYYLIDMWDMSQYFNFIVTSDFFLHTLFSPFMDIINLFNEYSLYKLILTIINIVIYLIAFQTCFKIVKGTI